MNTAHSLVPLDGYHRDTKDGNVVAMANIVTLRVTGSTGDDGGVEGKVRV